MEVLKRSVLLENSVDRNYNSPTYGVMTAETFFINVLLTQNIDDMGLFTDLEYVENDLSVVTNAILAQKLSDEGLTSPFMTGGTPISAWTLTNIANKIEKYTLRITGETASDFYSTINLSITGMTDSKIEDVKSYNRLTPFIQGFSIDKEQYINYRGNQINGVNQVTHVGEPTTYTFNAEDDLNIGTTAQTSGILYDDYTGSTRVINNSDGTISTIPITNFKYIGEGWNETNTSLSALTKQEYLFGIISVPEIQSDVFIDRGKTTVLEMHLRLSEIKNLDGLKRYGNGFYNLTTT